MFRHTWVQCSGILEYNVQAYLSTMFRHTCILEYNVQAYFSNVQAYLSTMFRHIWVQCSGILEYNVQAYLSTMFKHAWLQCSGILEYNVQAYLSTMFRHTWVQFSGIFEYNVQAYLSVLFRHTWVQSTTLSFGKGVGEWGHSLRPEMEYSQPYRGRGKGEQCLLWPLVVSATEVEYNQPSWERRMGKWCLLWPLVMSVTEVVYSQPSWGREKGEWCLLWPLVVSVTEMEYSQPYSVGGAGQQWDPKSVGGEAQAQQADSGNSRMYIHFCTGMSSCLCCPTSVCKPLGNLFLWLLENACDVKLLFSKSTYSHLHLSVSCVKLLSVHRIAQQFCLFLLAERKKMHGSVLPWQTLEKSQFFWILIISPYLSHWFDFVMKWQWRQPYYEVTVADWSNSWNWMLSFSVGSYAVKFKFCLVEHYTYEQAYALY